MTDKVIVKVTARAGRAIPGYGSREQGETFELPSEIADYVATLDGFELATPPKPKTKSKPAAVKVDPANEEAENNAL